MDDLWAWKSCAELFVWSLFCFLFKVCLFCCLVCLVVFCCRSMFARFCFPFYFKVCLVVVLLFVSRLVCLVVVLLQSLSGWYCFLLLIKLCLVVVFLMFLLNHPHKWYKCIYLTNLTRRNALICYRCGLWITMEWSNHWLSSEQTNVWNIIFIIYIVIYWAQETNIEI